MFDGPEEPVLPAPKQSRKRRTSSDATAKRARTEEEQMEQQEDGLQPAPVLEADAATTWPLQPLPGQWRSAIVRSQTRAHIVRARCGRDSLPCFIMDPQQQVSARPERLVDTVLWGRVRCGEQTGFCMLSEGGHDYLTLCGPCSSAAEKGQRAKVTAKERRRRREKKNRLLRERRLELRKAAARQAALLEKCARADELRPLPLCIVSLAGACAALLARNESPLGFLPKGACERLYDREIRNALLAQDEAAGAVQKRGRSSPRPGAEVDRRHIAACRPHLLHCTDPHKRAIVLPKRIAAYLHTEYSQLKLRALQLIPERNMRRFAEHLARATKVVVATGAGISVSAGIPDFRTKRTGLYSKLAAYQLPTPQSMFDLRYFRENPYAFYHLVRKIWPGNHRPTRVHHFIQLLHRKGKLLRNFTQNIDDLERAAGIPPSKIFQAHGTFSTARCVDCSGVYDPDYVLDHLERGEWPRCDRTPDCAVRKVCDGKFQGLVKPGITFFGEDLASDFAEVAADDMGECDALIVLGTSLRVSPFSCLPAMTRPFVPRLMIDLQAHEIARRSGFVVDSDWGVRDVCWAGQCNDGIDELCHMLGWQDELEALVAEDAAAGAVPGPQ
eukprot:TRINITY_DN4957_c0_g1_i1.p1 TRINITY_DN4957_c0_g1~~TRINITY_DN4957_c0_g1_i1.p1  ORF type:complete len:614 (+),score=98.08 TRINITY_DN4957_c0_g1_i1:140-1981(+)